ncbi:hypothetical protein PN497_21955 [Sphaerospermopsis kisseleviana CS-549]|uniref:Uncharacterized protein n=2 Tax=Sphaerospermopsis TaxID=752201 RepID=A0ABR9VJP6_9CYAN|nr:MULTISPECIES: hypothetical protein [Sphaerospermopsis]MBE9238729.1 hypothetical protein [Sphaerospermopsis aphanizomenoides LEGE 00250]MDB9443992.1 hypothetical protein [Sphaerospermopsis kisseleviana CS-549]
MLRPYRSQESGVRSQEAEGSRQKVGDRYFCPVTSPQSPVTLKPPILKRQAVI